MIPQSYLIKEYCSNLKITKYHVKKVKLKSVPIVQHVPSLVNRTNNIQRDFMVMHNSI